MLQSKQEERQQGLSEHSAALTACTGIFFFISTARASVSPVPGLGPVKYTSELLAVEQRRSFMASAADYLLTDTALCCLPPTHTAPLGCLSAVTFWDPQSRGKCRAVPLSWCWHSAGVIPEAASQHRRGADVQS